MLKKKDLVSIIQQTAPFKDPKIELEQYCIDAQSAVDLIFFAGVEYNDIANCLIFDLGGGTGRLSLASAYFSPYYIISIDIDLEAIQILKENILDLELEDLIFPINMDVKELQISRSMFPKEIQITTIMNPPFGVQKPTADRIFLEKAFTFSDVVYSIHLAGNKIKSFISRYIDDFGWKIDYILPFNMLLEHSFRFHSKKVKKIDVSIYRFIKKG
ncbi:MAG: METTL5 family protein [Promethearchaeota archaeon]